MVVFQICNSDEVKSGKEKENHNKNTIVVPKLPFDVDLYHWEDEQLTVPRILP